MSFLIYFFVLLVSVSSVLFGLDLMSSPLPRTPNVPIGRSVQVATTPVPQARRKEAAQKAAQKTADERALTPVHPAAPPAPKFEAQTSGTAAQDEAKLTPPPVPPAPQVQHAPPAAPATSVAQAPAQPPAQAAAKPSAQPPPATAEPKEAKTAPVSATPLPAKQASNSCNVQACGAAYQSFRASDCTYQPYTGERRACTIASGAVTAAAMPPRIGKPAGPREASGDKDELRDVERIVKRQPLSLQPSEQRARVSRDEPVERARANRNEMSEVERIVRRMTRDETADIPVRDADGRVFIVRKSYRY